MQPTGIQVSAGQIEVDAWQRENPGPVTHRFYITFGVQYGTPYQVAHNDRKPHPSGEWITGDGYATVEYQVPPWTDRPGARNIARGQLFEMLDGGRWAFDYEQPPEPYYAPAGELAVFRTTGQGPMEVEVR